MWRPIAHVASTIDQPASNATSRAENSGADQAETDRTSNTPTVSTPSTTSRHRGRTIVHEIASGTETSGNSGLTNPPVAAAARSEPARIARIGRSEAGSYSSLPGEGVTRYEIAKISAAIVSKTPRTGPAPQTAASTTSLAASVRTSATPASHCPLVMGRTAAIAASL